MAYSDKVIDHYENPRNVGALDGGDAGVGTGSSTCPALSARRRSRPTMKSSPANCADAIVIRICPVLSPRSRCLTCPTPASNAVVMPSTRSNSRTASTPATGVRRPSGAPTRTRRARLRRCLACLLEPRKVATEKVSFLTGL